jgi:hypothetical protein
MTITTEQLDEIDRKARAAVDRAHATVMDGPATLQLVAVYRAALAWSEASARCAKLRAGWRIGGGDDNLVEIDRLDKIINDNRTELDRLLRGTP